MGNEVKKSYNLFKMWGSWVGFIIGVLVVYMSFVYMLQGENPLQFMYFINPISLLSNLFIDTLSRDLAIQFAIPMLMAEFLTTPIVFALYGWGIHSLFRKLK